MCGDNKLTVDDARFVQISKGADSFEVSVASDEAGVENTAVITATGEDIRYVEDDSAFDKLVKHLKRPSSVAGFSAGFVLALLVV